MKDSKDFKLLALFGLQAAQDAIQEQIELVQEAIALDHGYTKQPRRGRPPITLIGTSDEKQPRQKLSPEGAANVRAGQLKRAVDDWVSKIQRERLDPEVALKNSKVRLEVLKRLGEGGAKDSMGRLKTTAVTKARVANVAKARAAQAKKRQEAAALEPKKAGGKVGRKVRFKDKKKWIANVTEGARRAAARKRDAKLRQQFELDKATVAGLEQ